MLEPWNDGSVLPPPVHTAPCASDIGSKAMGEFVVLNSPESLYFSGTSAVLLSSVKEIFAASLGLSVDKSTNWDGLFVLNPFATPEAAVEVYVDGVSHLGVSIPMSKSYRVIIDSYELDSYSALRRRINKNVFNGHGSNIVHMTLNDGAEIYYYSHLFGDIKVPEEPKGRYNFLSASVNEDKEFLVELEVLKAIIEKVNSGKIKPDDMIDFYEFRFTTLKSISDHYGPNSGQTREAKSLLADAVEALNKAFVRAYQGSVLVTLVAADISGQLSATRRKTVLRDTKAVVTLRSSVDY